MVKSDMMQNVRITSDDTIILKGGRIMMAHDEYLGHLGRHFTCHFVCHEDSGTLSFSLTSSYLVAMPASFRNII